MLGVLARNVVLATYANAEVVRPRKYNGRCPSVSVIIPCYNYGHYLTQCVRSVLSQKDVHVDILIIDDASSDGSDQTVRRLGEQDSRIRAICHAVNMGGVATCNEGMAHAAGDYTMVLSADDVPNSRIAGESNLAYGALPIGRLHIRPRGHIRRWCSPHCKNK